jgi:hypothetical protein
LPDYRFEEYELVNRPLDQPSATNIQGKEQDARDCASDADDWRPDGGKLRETGNQCPRQHNEEIEVAHAYVRPEVRHRASVIEGSKKRRQFTCGLRSA